MRYPEATSYTSTIYTPVLCTVLQGRKDVQTADRSVDLRAGDSLIVSHELPVMSRVTEASVSKPYLAVVVPIDLGMLRSLDTDMGDVAHDDSDTPALSAGAAEDEVHDVLLRLLRLAERPIERGVLAPVLMRELHVRLLLSEHGGTLRGLLDLSSNASRIARAIELIRTDFALSLSVESMARAAAMSESTFHSHFKRITGTTPVQYVKDFRLLEARRQMREEGSSAANAAAAVGYKSVSHFSRDYARKFGVSHGSE
ncbi:MAG: AraC family transcriptional regulator [Planctomycetota bacterium]